MTSTNFNSLVTGVAHEEKLENFGGVDFKRWQQKMLLQLHDARLWDSSSLSYFSRLPISSCIDSLFHQQIIFSRLLKD